MCSVEFSVRKGQCCGYCVGVECGCGCGVGGEIVMNSNHFFLLFSQKIPRDAIYEMDRSSHHTSACQSFSRIFTIFGVLAKSKVLV